VHALTLAVAAPEARGRLPAVRLRSASASAGTMSAPFVAPGLANRELGYDASRRRLTFGARQRRPNQGPPEESFFRPSVRRFDRRSRLRFGLDQCRTGNDLRLDRGVEQSRRDHCVDVGRIGFEFGFGWFRLVGEAGGRLRSLQSVEDLRKERRFRFLATLRRDLAFPILVLGVTDDAPRLFDVVFDHRHDGVIRDTALARTVVVQHVAGPKPALLHALPRKR
jgi:hypothetical protein